MSQSLDYPAWIGLFMGLYALAAGLGEWRVPGTWQKMLDEFARSPALLIVVSFFEVTVGAVIYLACPWNPGDVLSCAMKILGGVMVIEGLLLAAVGDRFVAFWSRILGPLMRAWLLLAAVLGVSLIAATLPRF